MDHFEEDGKRFKKPRKVKKTQLDKDCDVVNDIDSVTTKRYKRSRRRKDRTWDEEHLETVIVEDEFDEVSDGEDGFHFEALPNEFMETILMNMDIKTLCEVSTTSKAMNRLVWSLDRWTLEAKRFYLVPHDILDNGIRELENLTDSDERRNVFIDLYREEFRQKGLERDRRREHVLKKTYRLRLKVFKNTFLSHPADQLSLICLFLQIFFITFKLEEYIVFSWRIVLIPMLIPLLQFNFTLIFYDLLKSCELDYSPNRLRPPGDTESIWRYLLVRKRIFRLQVYLIVSCLNISYIFLMIKANESMDGIHSAAVLTPLMAVCVLVLSAAISKKYPLLKMVFNYILVILCLLMLLQFIFLTIRIEEHVLWPWRYTFMPIWIVLSIVCILSLIALFYDCATEALNDDRFFLLSLFTSVITFIIPVMTTLALISIHLDSSQKSRSWITIMIPIYVVIGLFTLMYIVLKIDFVKRRRRRMGN